jgi:hypothetical protein
MNPQFHGNSPIYPPIIFISIYISPPEWILSRVSRSSPRAGEKITFGLWGKVYCAVNEVIKVSQMGNVGPEPTGFDIIEIVPGVKVKNGPSDMISL